MVEILLGQIWLKIDQLKSDYVNFFRNSMALVVSVSSSEKIAEILRGSWSYFRFLAPILRVNSNDLC